ncbi:RNA methyltransferase [soil metagenome]
MPKITSRDNQKLKFARKVREGRTADSIFVEGLRLAEEVLRSNTEIREIFFTSQFTNTLRGKAFLENAPTANIFEVSESSFNSLSDTKSSQGIVVICAKPETGQQSIEINLASKKREFPLVVLLHEINNPATLGAILRTSEAAGVSGVILTRNSVDSFAPKSLRASMGAALRLPIWTNADFFAALKWANANNLTSVCADVKADKSYTEINWKKPRLLIFGSEAHGLSANECEKIDESLIIPMENEVESLNLAVSCGIILFEAKRQSDHF